MLVSKIGIRFKGRHYFTRFFLASNRTFTALNLAFLFSSSRTSLQNVARRGRRPSWGKLTTVAATFALCSSPSPASSTSSSSSSCAAAFKRIHPPYLLLLGSRSHSLLSSLAHHRYPQLLQLCHLQHMGRYRNHLQSLLGCRCPLCCRRSSFLYLLLRPLRRRRRLPLGLLLYPSRLIPHLPLHLHHL